MTKMAAMPIYGKNQKKKSSPGPKGRWPWNLVCSVGMQLEYYQVCSNDEPWLTLTYFTTRSNLVPYAFVWEKSKTMDFFRNYCRLWFETSNRWPKWQEVSADFKTLSPGAVCPLPRGCLHVLNHEKNLYKIRLQRDFFETCTKWEKG